MRQFINNHFKNSGLVVVIAVALCAIGGGSAVAGSMITGKNVKNSSLTGVDIKNKSIGKGDLSAAALAGIKGDKGDAGAAGATGATGATGSHGPLAYTGSSSISSVYDTAYESITGGTTQILVPEGANSILVEFSAECAVVHAADYVSQEVQVRVDNVPVGNAATFCSNSPAYNIARYNNQSMQRVAIVEPGVHIVTVVHSVNDADASGYLDDKQLTAITG